MSAFSPTDEVDCWELYWRSQGQALSLQVVEPSRNVHKLLFFLIGQVPNNCFDAKENAYVG